MYGFIEAIWTWNNIRGATDLSTSTYFNETSAVYIDDGYSEMAQVSSADIGYAEGRAFLEFDKGWNCGVSGDDAPRIIAGDPLIAFAPPGGEQWARIDPENTTPSQYVNNWRRETLAHEVGHVWGSDHSLNLFSRMVEGGNLQTTGGIPNAFLMADLPSGMARGQDPFPDDRALMRLMYPSNWAGQEVDIATTAQYMGGNNPQDIQPTSDDVCPGDVISQRLAVINNGEVGLGFDFQVILHESDTLNEMHEFQSNAPGVIDMTGIRTGSLGSGFYATQFINITVPDDVENDTGYYMYFVLDPLDRIQENTESNNVIRYGNRLWIDDSVQPQRRHDLRWRHLQWRVGAMRRGPATLRRASSCSEPSGCSCPRAARRKTAPSFEVSVAGTRCG